MFLKDQETGDLVRVVDLGELFDPFQDSVLARDQAGQEEQDPVSYAKRQLVFPSGERLPRCWMDVHYRETARPRAPVHFAAAES
jgi:hypothetical protein